ncbi:hypothetical protein B0H14DRAFT_2633399 [Mycena olivaceomarginata]|nr:hypothetical protein B0H14DRAFT_2633399 [Mycena olivaceomarginata]
MCAVKNAHTASATESATPLDAQVEERISTVSSRTTRTPQPPSTFSLPVSFLRSFQCAEFSNGVTIISLYLNPLPGAEASSVPPIEHTIHQVKKEASLFCLPDNPFFPPKGPGSHAVQKATYTLIIYTNRATISIFGTARSQTSTRCSVQRLQGVLEDNSTRFKLRFIGFKP